MGNASDRPVRYQLSEDQTMILDSVRRFAEAEVQPKAYEWDRDAGVPASLLSGLAELGLMGMRVSEEAGGTALDAISALLAIETLASADGGLAWIAALHNLLALPALEAAKDTGLASFASGERVIAWFEADMIVAQEGSGVTLSGTAALVPWAVQAGGYVGLAHGSNGPVLVAVEPDAPGMNATAIEGAMGLRSSAPGTVRFESTPARTLAGVVQDDLTAWLRMSRAAVAVGVAKGALSAATRYAQERQQFSKPIAQFQAVQWMLADTATEIDAAQLLTWSAVVDDKVQPAAAARASLYALPAATRAGMRAVQVFGGNGYVREYPVERCLRDAKALEVLAPVDDAESAVVDSLITPTTT